MEWIDFLAPHIDGVEDPTPLYFEIGATTEVAIDVEVEDDGWVTRLLDESDQQVLMGDKRQALELLGVALRIDRTNDALRARYFALASELTARRERGDETLQISQR